MEVDTRFPTTQANQSLVVRGGESPAPAQVPVDGAGAETEFYISPVLRFDSRSLTVIFQVRDSGSGDVVRQFPPETVVERYRQDPTAKPFVLSARDAAGADDAAPDELAPFSTPDEGGRTLVGAASSGATDAAGSSGAPTDEQSGGEPVNLVA